MSKFSPFFFLIPLLLIPPLLLGKPTFANPTHEGIDNYFSDYNHSDTPGASVLIIQNGSVTYSRGYGLANLEKKTPVTLQTNFRLASLTKQFTATAILLLVQENKLSLNTKLQEIVPDFPDYARDITIRHLLNHTSGLFDYETLIPTSQLSQISDAEVLDLLKQQTGLYFFPGSQYRYSNGGYVLLGLIVELITEQSFSQFLKQNIFNPLQMKNTQMYDGEETLITHRAYGYTKLGTTFTKTDQSITSATKGDGGVYTSASDWILWENSIHHNLLISNSLQETAFSKGKLNDGSFTSYGFGWMLDTFKGWIHQYHTGSTIGFRTAIDRFPEKNLAILVLINRSNANPWEISQSIAQLYF